ncbi:MAG TPA: cbb3-type cytochrome c oxidase subunit 3 [Candidatus Eisenbacteria bacterium]|jgi:cbb3-type cytochrome oxidase subunit 3
MLRLSDVMSHAGLHGFAEVALVLFFLAFLAIVVRLFAPSRKREMDAMAAKPLEDDRIEPTSPGERE